MSSLTYTMKISHVSIGDTILASLEKLTVNINVTGQSLHEVEGKKSPTEQTTILPVDWSWAVTQKVPLTLWSLSWANAQTTPKNK